MKERFIEAGEIVNTHGVRGEIKILPWTDSAEFLAAFRTLYIDGKTGPGALRARAQGHASSPRSRAWRT